MPLVEALGNMSNPKIRRLLLLAYHNTNPFLQPFNWKNGSCRVASLNTVYCHRNLNMDQQFQPYSTGIRMPSLSPTMTEGTITKWHKAEGDRVQPGDLLCDIQTDKAVVSFEFDDEGVLAKVLRPEGESGSVGDIIAVMADPSEDWKAIAKDAASFAKATVPQPPAASPSHAPAAVAPAAPPQQKSSSPPRRVGPAAQLLLRAHHLSATDMRATGPHGTLLKSDVLQRISAATSTSSAAPSSTISAAPATTPKTSASLAASLTIAGSRPVMTRLEPRAPPADHPVGPGLREWAAGQAAAKLVAPHAYATVACRPYVPQSTSAASPSSPSMLGALAVRALASALSSANGAPVSVGLLVLAAPALPRVALLSPRAQALGLREIAVRLAAAQSDASTSPAESGGESSGLLDAVVCDLSRQGSVLCAHLPLNPAAPLLLTIGRPHSAAESSRQQVVQLGLTADSRLLDHAQAAQLLGAVAAGMENPLLGAAGATSWQTSATGAAAATTLNPPIVGSDILQLGLDD